MSEAYGDGKRRKPLEVTSLVLEQKLWAWIQFVEAQNVCISRELIRMKAQDLQKELCDAWDLRFSDGWLTGFERRHALRYRQRHGEAASADTAAIYLGRQQLQDLTDQYEPQNVYNMDETGLCYAMAPSRSICTGGARGVKKTKTRITVALTSNADGSDALPPLILGRAKQPLCFKKRTAAQLGFKYKSNQKAWMTGHQERRGDQGSNVYKVDQLQAMSWSKEIWQELQGKATIEICFRHTGIVFNGADERSKEETSYGQDLKVEDIIIRAAELNI
ncbi:unnamed protein product [Phytophthora lilii]|uniref:Unnamed protein product n=1 Tax=Phytophthora lilii TaxID=2077276 RepID=A0A9W6TXV6_9STRA|nr:unnamed protein product [Phytophthora lilii]